MYSMLSPPLRLLATASASKRARLRPLPTGTKLFLSSRQASIPASILVVHMARSCYSTSSSSSTAVSGQGAPAPSPARIAHIVALPIPLSGTSMPPPDTDHPRDTDPAHHQRLLHRATVATDSHLWLFLSPPTLPAAPPAPNHHTHTRFSRGWWAHKLSHDWPNRVSHEWSELNQPDAAQWKRKVHALGSKLLAALPWTELVAKKWVAPVQHVVLYHPASVEAVTAHRQLAKFVAAHLDQHVAWRKISALGLPFSILAGIIPGPNLPLLYNAFRVYSHHVAAANLASVNESMNEGALSTIEIPDLDPLVPQLSPASALLDLKSPDLHAALSSALGLVGQASTLPEHLCHSAATSAKLDVSIDSESHPLLATYSDQLAADALHALRQEAKKHTKNQDYIS